MKNFGYTKRNSHGLSEKTACPFATKRGIINIDSNRKSLYNEPARPCVPTNVHSVGRNSILKTEPKSYEF